MTIGSRIREIRGDKTVTEFCRIIDVHRNTLPSWESGKTSPDGEILARICDVFDIDANWLLLGIGSKDHIVTPPSDIDEDILRDVIEGFEENMKTRGKVMTPEKKATVITELYMIILEEEEEDQQKKRDNLARILKLVA